MNWKPLLALGDQRGHLASGNEKLSTLGCFFFISQKNAVLFHPKLCFHREIRKKIIGA